MGTFENTVRFFLTRAGFTEMVDREGFDFFGEEEIHLLHVLSGVGIKDTRLDFLEKYQEVLSPYFETTVEFPVLHVKKKNLFLEFDETEESNYGYFRCPECERAMYGGGSFDHRKTCSHYRKQFDYASISESYEECNYCFGLKALKEFYTWASEMGYDKPKLFSMGRSLNTLIACFGKDFLEEKLGVTL